MDKDQKLYTRETRVSRYPVGELCCWMRYWKCCIRIWWQFSICFASENRDNIYFPLLLLILRREFRIFDDLSNATNRISDYFSARF